MEPKPADRLQFDGDGTGLDHLPERLRRWQRFGGARAAALAEAEALRREIDALAARLAQSEAYRAETGRCHPKRRRNLGGAEGMQQSPGATDALPLATPVPLDESLRAWLALRRAGLAVGDAIARLAVPQNAAAD